MQWSRQMVGQLHRQRQIQKAKGQKANGKGQGKMQKAKCKGEGKRQIQWLRQWLREEQWQMAKAKGKSQQTKARCTRQTRYAKEKTKAKARAT